MKNTSPSKIKIRIKKEKTIKTYEIRISKRFLNKFMNYEL